VKDELSGPHIRLRPWRHADTIVQDSWPPFSDPTQVFWHIPRRITFAEMNWNYDYDPSRYIWAVELHNGELIGRVSLRDVDKRKSEARLGISFGSPYVSQGLGSETMRVFLTYCFKRLGFQRIVLDVAATNRRAVATYERLGFRQIGNDWRSPNPRDDLSFLDDPHYKDLLPYIRRSRQGVWVEFFEMELTSSEWFEKQQSQP
jgi:RimJ/RimL family protein N-acetyltransferase